MKEVVGLTVDGPLRFMAGDILRIPEAYLYDVQDTRSTSALPLLPKRTLCRAPNDYTFLVYLLGLYPTFPGKGAHEGIAAVALNSLKECGFIPSAQAMGSVMALANHIEKLELLLQEAGLPIPERPSPEAIARGES